MSLFLKKTLIFAPYIFTPLFKTILLYMIVVHIKDNEPIDKALKRFKKKFEKTGVLKELRRRTYFEKKSVELRTTKQRAAYRQKLRDEETI